MKIRLFYGSSADQDPVDHGIAIGYKILRECNDVAMSIELRHYYRHFNELVTRTGWTQFRCWGILILRKHKKEKRVLRLWEVRELVREAAKMQFDEVFETTTKEQS